MSLDNNREFNELTLSEPVIDYLFRRLHTNNEQGSLKIQVISPKIASNPSETVLFEKNKIIQYSQDIDFLFGQLLVAHTSNAKYFTPEAGCIDYFNAPWTHDIDTLLNLYAMGIANKTMSPFMSKGGKVVAMLDPNLIPTFSPVDPIYKKWIDQYKSQYKPKFKSGREPVDD